jgi:hypothetical protein
MNNMAKRVSAGLVVVIVIALMIATPMLFYFGVRMGADKDYNTKFGAHVTMAKDQATFEGMELQIQILYANMNSSFAGRDFNTTYSTWWGPDQTYENSLQAQADYFVQLMKSIDRYIATYDKIINSGNTTAYINDWYYQAIQNVRNEMNREGGLDWALKNAFYLNLYPTAYWMLAYIIIIEIIHGIIIVAIAITSRDY